MIDSQPIRFLEIFEFQLLHRPPRFAYQPYEKYRIQIPKAWFCTSLPEKLRSKNLPSRNWADFGSIEPNSAHFSRFHKSPCKLIKFCTVREIFRSNDRKVMIRYLDSSKSDNIICLTPLHHGKSSLRWFRCATGFYQTSNFGKIRKLHGFLVTLHTYVVEILIPAIFFSKTICFYLSHFISWWLVRVYLVAHGYNFVIFI